MVEENKQEKSKIDLEIEEMKKKLKEMKALKKGNFSVFYNKARKGVLEISKKDISDKEKISELKTFLVNLDKEITEHQKKISGESETEEAESEEAESEETETNNKNGNKTGNKK